MDLIVVDGDCCSLWNNVSELERLLNASHDTIWFFEDALLREKNFNVYAAAQVPIGVSIEKGILLTKMQSGVMKYHKEMLLHTFGCQYWMIVILDENNNIYRKQYCAGFDSALAGTSVRYEIIFDDSNTLNKTLEAKKEIVDGRPYCIIATKTDQQLAETVKAVLDVYYDKWRIECHVGWKEDSYKHADIILLVGKTEEDYQVPATQVNTGRVRIWTDLHKGTVSNKAVYERTACMIDRMNEFGWNLGKHESKRFGSCLEYEVLLTEFHKGEISVETLRTDDRFILWDQYGLPLSEQAYRNAEKTELFLREQCCLANIF